MVPDSGGPWTKLIQGGSKLDENLPRGSAEKGNNHGGYGYGGMGERRVDVGVGNKRKKREKKERRKKVD